MKKILVLAGLVFVSFAAAPLFADDGVDHPKQERKLQREEKAEEFWKSAAEREELKEEREALLSGKKGFGRLTEKEKIEYILENSAKHPRLAIAAFEYAENHPKVMRWLSAHHRFAEWVVNHPKAAELLENHPQLARLFARHPGAAKLLESRPELRKYLKDEWLEHKERKEK